jgi:hypothetical protein
LIKPGLSSEFQLLCGATSCSADLIRMTKDDTVNQRDTRAPRRRETNTQRKKTPKDKQKEPKTLEVLLEQPLQMVALMLTTND